MKNKKSILLTVFITLAVVFVILAGLGYWGYKTYIEPNTDSEETVVIDGNEVTVETLTPVTFYNRSIDMSNEMIAELDTLNDMDSDNTVDEITSQKQQVISLANQNIETLESYSTTLSNYNEYKELIDASIKYYSDNIEAVENYFTGEFITVISEGEAQGDLYDRYSEAVEQYNDNINEAENAYYSAIEDFEAEFNI